MSAKPDNECNVEKSTLVHATCNAEADLDPSLCQRYDDKNTQRVQSDCKDVRVCSHDERR